MQLTIPTIEEIRAAVREELAAFSVSTQIPQAETPDEFGGVEFASRITGKAVPTIYALVSNRQIPHSKRGKRLYFSRQELIEWIKQGKRKTQTEIQADSNNYSIKQAKKGAR